MTTLTIRGFAQAEQRMQAWLRLESKSFSFLCGEPVTHLEVVKAHAVLVVLLMGLGLAGAIG